MTNNELLNAVYKEGFLGSLPVEQRKTWEGKAFTYLSDLTLTANTPAYAAFEVGDEPVHMKRLGIVTDGNAVVIEVSEGPTYTGGTEATPVSPNRKTKVYDYRDEFATMAYDTATALKKQPLVGAPVIRRVMNNGNVLYPDIAIEVTDICDGFGFKVNQVPQVDASQGLKIKYKSKQVRSANKSETITTYVVDVPVTLTYQSHDGKAPVISTVYNNNTIPLAATVDYTITEDEMDGWQITLLDESTTLDPAKNIVVSYIVTEEYHGEFEQVVMPFGFDCATLAIGTPSGTFTEGEVVKGGTSNATGVMAEFESGYMHVINVDGTFESGETITGQDSNATVDLTSDGALWYCVVAGEQSYDDSAITLLSAENGTRGSIVEYLSLSQDYTFALDGTYKITLKDTAKTSSTKPVIVLYQGEDLASQSDNVSILAGPTVSVQGALIDKYVLPAPSNVCGGQELVLRPNTKYLVKVVSTAPQSVLVKYNWYME